MHEEMLVRLYAGIAIDCDIDLSRALAGGDQGVAGTRLIVVVSDRGSAVGSGVIEGDGLAAGLRQTGSEAELRGAAVAFGKRDVIDAESRRLIIIENCSGGVGR